MAGGNEEHRTERDGKRIDSRKRLVRGMIVKGMNFIPLTIIPLTRSGCSFCILKGSVLAIYT
jgi:hypothetical protein